MKLFSLTVNYEIEVTKETDVSLIEFVCDFKMKVYYLRNVIRVVRGNWHLMGHIPLRDAYNAIF